MLRTRTSILTGSEFLDNPETDSTKICCQPQDTVVLFWFRFNLYSVLLHEILTVFIVRVCGPFNSFSWQWPSYPWVFFHPGFLIFAIHTLYYWEGGGGGGRWQFTRSEWTVWWEKVPLYWWLRERKNASPGLFFHMTDGTKKINKIISQHRGRKATIDIWCA